MLPNSIKKKILYFLFILSVLLVGFIILEVSYRIITPEKIFTKDIHRVPEPYIMFSGAPNYSDCKNNVCVHHNELGMRGELPSEKKENEYRILVFGGSTVYNGEPLSNSIPLQIEHHLKEKGLKEAKVYNWGVVSVNSAQQLILFLTYGLDYNPDFVIFYQGNNEFQPYLYDPRPNYPFNYLVYQGAIESFQNNVLTLSAPQLFGLLLRKSKVIDEIFKENVKELILDKQKIKEGANYGSEKWKEEIIRNYINNIEKASIISEGKDIEFAAFHQPIIYFKNNLTEKEEKLSKSVGLLLAGFPEFIKEVYPEAGRNLEQLSLKYSSFSYKDIKDIFANDSNEYFRDFVHVNSEGNDIIAKKIADEIYPMIKKDLKSK